MAADAERAALRKQSHQRQDVGRNEIHVLLLEIVVEASWIRRARQMFSSSLGFLAAPF
jgi:hypothetical protein